MSHIQIEKITRQGKILSVKRALEILGRISELQLSIEEYRVVYLSLYFQRIDLFARDVCKRWTCDPKTLEAIESPEFHKELWEAAKKPEDLLAIISRDHGKTTSISKILVLWLLLFQVEPSILLLMSKGMGEKVVGDIRRELETNKVIRVLWGNLVPIHKGAEKAERWRQRELNLTNGTELKTITKGEPVRGRRPTKVIVDDPEEIKDVRNPQTAREFYTWVFTSVYPTISDGGSMIVPGTILSHNCFVNTLKQDAPRKNFKVIEYPAIIGFDPKKSVYRDEEGKLRLKREGLKPLWGDRWSLDALEKRLQKMGLAEFCQEYMNLPMQVNGQPVFSEEYEYIIMQPVTEKDGVQYFRELLEEKEVTEKDGTKKKVMAPIYSGFVGMDFSHGRVGGDYSTITMRTIEGKLLAQYRGYCAQDVLAKVLDSMLAHVKDCKIVPENNTALAFLQAARNYGWYRSIYRQKTLDKITNQASETLGWNTNSKTKPLLINGLDQKMRDGKWEVSAEEYEEITHYYYDEKGGMNALAPYHDDLVISDALSVQAINSGVTAPFLAFV